MISITSLQIVITYWEGQGTPFQQFAFLFQREIGFSSELINVTISGSNINIFTTPSYEYTASKVYSGALANMHKCMGYMNEAVLMGLSCSSLKVFVTQGFYTSPLSRSYYNGVSVKWIYTMLGFTCTTAVCLVGVVVMLACYLKLRCNPEIQALLAN
jgi:hypothetical protein